MQLSQFYTDDRTQWRAWLDANFETEKEIWLVFPMKASGQPRLSYNDAVEEALCFGWIDSTIRNLDSTHRAQRFTPRKQGKDAPCGGEIYIKPKSLPSHSEKNSDRKAFI